jgi:hypothetical protein
MMLDVTEMAIAKRIVARNGNGVAQHRDILAALGDLRAMGTFDLDDAFYRTDGRCTYIHFGPVTTVPHEVIASTLNRSYTMTAEIERLDPCSQGVVIALGNDAGNSVLLVHDNQLVHQYHYASACYAIRSDRTVPIGRVTLRFAFRKTGHLQGTGELYIDGYKVGEALIPHTIPYYSVKGGAGADICPNRAPLFSGIVRQVTIEIAAPPMWNVNLGPQYSILERS